MRIRNLLLELPDASAAEVFERLPLSGDSLRIERIVSQGQATAPGQWYE
jgi:cupin 2 domain-containing protein